MNDILLIVFKVYTTFNDMYNQKVKLKNRIARNNTNEFYKNAHNIFITNIDIDEKITQEENNKRLIPSNADINTLKKSRKIELDNKIADILKINNYNLEINNLKIIECDKIYETEISELDEIINNKILEYEKKFNIKIKAFVERRNCFGYLLFKFNNQNNKINGLTNIIELNKRYIDLKKYYKITYDIHINYLKKYNELITNYISEIDIIYNQAKGGVITIIHQLEAEFLINKELLHNNYGKELLRIN